MNGKFETKSEIRARIDELRRLKFENLYERDRFSDHFDSISDQINTRISELETEMSEAEEDLSSSIIRSHKAICKAKKMDEKAAYGNDPAIYYTLGICSEAGEISGGIVKALRNGSNSKASRDKILETIKSELPDVIIYSYVLAHVLDIDLSKLVNEKVDIVVQRAVDGYYGEELAADVPGSIKNKETP